MCAVVFISIKPLFRVLSDETNLLAISKSMTYDKRTDNVTMGNYYYDNFYAINRETPKRPLLFPFLASLMHTFLGYRPINLFILNFLVLLALFSLTFVLMKKYLGNIWAYSSVFLLASQPIITQNATSGGFDLIASLFMVICFASLLWFLKNPDALRFQFLWISLLLLANARYENILCFFVVFGMLAIFKYVKMGYFKSKTSFVYFATPVLLLPILWQRLLIPNSYDTDQVPFGFSYFIVNSAIFIKSLFDFKFFLPYATIVNLIGFLGLIYFIISYNSNKIRFQNYQKQLIYITSACVFLHWLLFISYYLGRVDHPSAARLFALFYIVFPIVALLFAHNFRYFKEKPIYILIFSIAMFMVYHPVSVQDRFSRSQILPREYRFTMDHLKKAEKLKRNFLVIANRPGQYTVWDYGAVNFPYANEVQSVKDAFNNHLYENIYAIQNIEYKTMQPTADTKLAKDFALETIAEMQNNMTYFTRISKVKSIK